MTADYALWHGINQINALININKFMQLVNMEV